ncbi:MAG: cation:proton antiporter [Lachnospiraceae bacterium]|nr:cation:proton antiporter [Lachnospiraceae bacterium]
MLLSVSLIIIVGLALGAICQKLKLPSLVGMLLTGVILGPYVLDLIDPSILNISAQIRKIALIIILARAGLGLDISGLKKIGRPAVLMCFVPATFELAGVLLLAPSLLGLSLMEAAVMGAVLAAVSPAVVVPRMIKLMEKGYGRDKSIPELILAGASVDDVYVIVLFTTFTGIMQGQGVSAVSFINIPVSIALGVVVGAVAGFLLAELFKVFHMRDTVKTVIMLCVCMLLTVAEDNLNTPVTFASLISVMAIGVALQRFHPPVVERLSAKFGKLWVVGEVFLFVLVGASVNINYLGNVGLGALLMIVLALVFRMLGVFVCLIRTPLNYKERLFTMMAYCPKATVQAAIGGIPLALGFACGDTVLTVAVLAIVLTAPLGAFAIDLSYRKLLKN